MQFIDEVEREPLTLAQAAKQLPGRKRDPSTLWRWVRRGRQINGHQVKLEVIEVGRELLTSKPAIRRFIQRCTEARGLETNIVIEAVADDTQIKNDLADAGI